MYWQLRQQTYPVLSKLAIDVLTIPASAADCERTFSELGDMLGTRRLRMKPELINALQCIKSWKRAGITSTGGPGYSEDEIARIQAQLTQFEAS